MIAYVDTSVVLQFILEGDVALNRAFEFPTTVSSELLEIEAVRTLERLRMQRVLDDQTRAEATIRLQSVLDALDVWEISRAVKTRSRDAFPTIIGTLDAIHLATALCHPEAREPKGIGVFTYDRQMALCAAALGMTTPLG
ncbi:MAG: PIN domain-containing protein [Spirochaetales bacterium]|nr:PIN domain-containing protein [Spirochaetales bacterium]